MNQFAQRKKLGPEFVRHFSLSFSIAFVGITHRERIKEELSAQFVLGVFSYSTYNIAYHLELCY